MVSQSPLLDLANNVKTILTVIFIIILIVGSIILLAKARKIEFLATKRIFQGYALFGFCFASTRIFFLLSTFYGEIQLTYPTNSWDNTYWGLINNIFVVCAYAVTMAAIVFIFRVVEHYILNKKPIFAIIAVCSLGADILALILTFLNFSFFLSNSNIYLPIVAMNPKDFANLVESILSPILGLAICVLYLIIVKSSTGSIKKKALETFIGVFLLLMGILLDMNILSSITVFNPFRYMLTPTLMIIGVLIVFYSLK